MQGNDHEKNFNASYTVPFFINRAILPSFFKEEVEGFNAKQGVPAMLSLQADLETQNTKHESREKSYILNFGLINSPWNVKLMRTFRMNKIDAFSSRDFLVNDALPSLKHSVALDYQLFGMDYLTRFSTELAIPVSNQNRSANFIKFDLRH